MICSRQFLAAVLVPALAFLAPGFAAERSLSLLHDFSAEPPGPLPAFTHHSWSTGQVTNASRFSEREIVQTTGDSARALRLKVSPDMPWTQDAYPLFTLGPDYLPPEADAVRLKVKSRSGKLILALGSPTVYFGNSDVVSEFVEIEGSDGGWRNVEFSLNRKLHRNYRRAGFSAKSPVIYYPRWIQEPLYLYVVRGSAGEAWISQPELVAKGEGRPFPDFAPGDIVSRRAVADFAKPDAVTNVFSFTHHQPDFAASQAGGKLKFGGPARLGWTNLGGAGAGSFVAQLQGREEVSFVGVKLPAVPDANALRVDLQMTGAPRLRELVIDFVIYAVPPKARAQFPWDRARGASAAKPGRGFDFDLSQEMLAGFSCAIYHARRVVPNGQRSALVIPFADFVCFYGDGECADQQRRQRALTGDELFLLGFLPPFRQRSAPTEFVIRRIDLVSVPGPPERLRSFWQIPSVEEMRLERDRRFNAYGGLWQLSPKSTR